MNIQLKHVINTSTETFNSWMLWTTGTDAILGSDNSPGIPGSLLYSNHKINQNITLNVKHINYMEWKFSCRDY